MTSRGHSWAMAFWSSMSMLSVVTFWSVIGVAIDVALYVQN
jgi:hypothetical protein